MKRNHIIGGILTLMLNVLIMYNVGAQPPVMPTLPDNPLFAISAPTSTIQNMNAAVLDYFPTPFVGSTAQIFAVVEYGNLNPGKLFVGVNGGMVISIAAPFDKENPDVVIGNSQIDPTRQFYVAVSYHSGTNGYIEIYQIDFFTPYFFAFYPGLVPISTTVIQNAKNIHMDIIVEDNFTSANGLPFCNNIAICWEDTYTGAVMGDLMAINSPLPSLPSWLGFTIATSGVTPDVAGVQKHTGGVSSPIHNYGLFTWVDPTIPALNYLEYDFVAMTPVAPSPYPLDFGPLSTPSVVTISNPRIDAPDFSAYSLGYVPGIDAQYKVVADVTYSTGAHAIRTYDNTLNTTTSWLGLGINFFWESSSVVTLPGQNISPCVAVNQPGMNYEVQHYNKNFVSGSGNVLLEPIRINNPIALCPPGQYFQINSSPANVLSSYGPNAISNAPNDLDRMGGGLLDVWGCLDIGGASYYTAYYKFAQVPFSGYGYRIGGYNNGNGDPSVSWSVYPNPAKNNLYISNGTGDNQSERYVITDITGKEIMTGGVNDITTQIDISSLMPGSFVISLYKDNRKTGTQTITKFAD